MSPTLNRSSALQRFQCGNVIEIHNGNSVRFLTWDCHICGACMCVDIVLISCLSVFYWTHVTLYTCLLVFLFLTFKTCKNMWLSFSLSLPLLSFPPFLHPQGSSLARCPLQTSRSVRILPKDRLWSTCFTALNLSVMPTLALWNCTRVLWAPSTSEPCPASLGTRASPWFLSSFSLSQKDRYDVSQLLGQEWCTCRSRGGRTWVTLQGLLYILAKSRQTHRVFD